MIILTRAYTHRGLGTNRASQHNNIIDSGKLTQFSCAPDGVRTRVTDIIECRVRRSTNSATPPPRHPITPRLPTHEPEDHADVFLSLCLERKHITSGSSQKTRRFRITAAPPWSSVSVSIKIAGGNFHGRFSYTSSPPSAFKTLVWACQIWRWVFLMNRAGNTEYSTQKTVCIPLWMTSQWVEVPPWILTPQLVPEVSPRWPQACSFECVGWTFL